MTMLYELQITPTQDTPDLAQLSVLAMEKSCSPFPVFDDFGRIYTA